jgi:hypothetical protein
MPQWYVAILAMECQIGGIPDGATDLQVRVISALDADEAYSKAHTLGAQAAVAYENTAGETVAWTFAGLYDLDNIVGPSLGDGTEVWSLMSRRPLRTLVRDKSQLAVFWLEENKDRTPRELLGGGDA